MSIVSEALKKLEEKRGLAKGHSDKVQNLKKKPLKSKRLFFVLGSGVIIAGFIYFLDIGVLEKQPAQKPVKEPVIKKIEEPAVMPGPAVVPANDAEETKRANEKEIEADVKKEIREKTAGITDEENIPPEIVLGGVITGEGEPYAIVNGKIVKKGTVVDGAEIISIGNNSVTYSFSKKEYTIKLR